MQLIQKGQTLTDQSAWMILYIVQYNACIRAFYTGLYKIYNMTIFTAL